MSFLEFVPNSKFHNTRRGIDFGDKVVVESGNVSFVMLFSCVEEECDLVVVVVVGRFVVVFVGFVIGVVFVVVAFACVFVVVLLVVNVVDAIAGDDLIIICIKFMFQFLKFGVLLPPQPRGLIALAPN